MAHGPRIDVDGLQYIEMARQAAETHGGSLINAYWSPLYAALLAVPLEVFSPTVEQEWVVVRLVEAAIWLFAVAGLGMAARKLASAVQSEPGVDKAWLALSAALFLYLAVWSLATERTSPDLLAGALAMWTVWAALGFDERPRSLSAAALLGFLLGLGYWAKTAMLPLGLLSMYCIVQYFGKPVEEYAKQLPNTPPEPSKA